MPHRQTRRRFLAGATAIPAALSLPAATTAAPSLGDSQLLALWNQYVAVRRKIRNLPLDTPDALIEPDWGKENAIEDRIMATPAVTRQGMLTKMRFVIMWMNDSLATELFILYGDPCSEDELITEPRDRMAWSLLADLSSLAARGAA